MRLVKLVQFSGDVHFYGNIDLAQFSRGKLACQETLESIVCKDPGIFIKAQTAQSGWILGDFIHYPFAAHLYYVLFYFSADSDVSIVHNENNPYRYPFVSPWTHLPSIRKRYIRMYFCEWKLCCFCIKISLQFVPNSPIDINLVLI